MDSELPADVDEAEKFPAVANKTPPPAPAADVKKRRQDQHRSPPDKP